METPEAGASRTSEMKGRVWIWIEEPDKFHSKLVVVEEVIDATILQEIDAEKVTRQANQDYPEYLWQPVLARDIDKFVVRGELRTQVMLHRQNAESNELKAMVVGDLAAICKKVAENSAVPDGLRVTARGMVEEYESLLPTHGRHNLKEHIEGENLLIRMAHFLTELAQTPSSPSEPSK
jgi:hypothetical protein